DARHHANSDARLQALAFGFALAPVLSHVLRDKETTRAIRRFDLAAVVADVVNSSFKIFGDPVGGGQIGRIIKPGSGNRHGNHIEPMSVEQVLSLPDDFLSRRTGDS